MSTKIEIVRERPNRFEDKVTLQSNSGPTGGIADWVSIKERDGEGIPTVSLLTQRTPDQNGETNLGHHLSPRQVTWEVEVYGSTKANLEANLLTLFSLFMPRSEDYSFLVPAYAANPNAVCIQYTLDTGAVRRLRVFVGAVTTYDTGRRRGWTQGLSIPFTAIDPLFYDPTPRTSSVTFSGGVGTSLSINYRGTYPDYSSILILGGTYQVGSIPGNPGPVTSATIYGAPNGYGGNQVLDMATITAGVPIFFDFGHQICQDQYGNSQTKALSNVSDMVNWRVPAATDFTTNPQSLTTNFSVTATCSGTADITIVSFEKYIGLES